MHIQKLAALGVFAVVSGLLSAQIAAPQNLQGVTIGGGVISTPPPPATTGIFFTPAAGSYPGSPQNIAVTDVPGGTGVALFYTKDGSTPSEASTRYSSLVPLSTATTLTALAENVGTVRQDTQNTSGLWKICTPNGGGPGTPTSVLCGGVGSTQPTGWTILYNQTIGGVTGVESISLTGSGSQILVTLGGSGCDSCNKITMDKWIKPLNSSDLANVINHEHDAWWNSGSTNRLNMIGFQCNQQSAFLQWQYDNEQGSWQNTGVADKCPLSTSLWTHLIVHAHWTIGDTGCGGLGCTHYDDFWVGTASTPSAGATMTQHILNRTLEQDNPGWGSGCADQDQVDLKSGVHMGGVLVAHNNVTCSFGTVTTGSAAYTF